MRVARTRECAAGSATTMEIDGKNRGSNHSDPGRARRGRSLVGRHRNHARVMAYGATRESAIAAVRALAPRVAAGCIDHSEETPEPFVKVFSEA